MNFELVDRIEALEPGRWLRAAKLTSRQEDVWEPARDGQVMRAGLVLEALCQAGGWLVYLSTERRSRGALAAVESAEFLGEVVPGDVLRLECRLEALDGERAVLAGEARVDDRPVLRASGIMCVLRPAEDLEDPSRTGRALLAIDRSAGT